MLRTSRKAEAGNARKNAELRQTLTILSGTQRKRNEDIRKTRERRQAPLSAGETLYRKDSPVIVKGNPDFSLREETTQSRCRGVA